MDYSYISGAQSQPLSLYGLHGLPTPDPNRTPHAADDLQDAFSAAGLNYPGGHGNNDDCNNNTNTNTNTNQGYLFDPSSFGLDPNAAPIVQPPPHSPPDSFTQPSDHTNTLNESNLGRSSSEEKDVLSQDPNKRKAQNRAAQRAFRERKERHVRDLELKVNNLEELSTALRAENDHLKQEVARFSTENEILRATSRTFGNSNNANNNHPHNMNGNRADSEQTTTTGPMKYTPMDFSSSSTLVANGERNVLHRTAVCPTTGEKLLDTRATWDLIQGHDLFKQGLVDITHVSNRLKNLAQCNGQGPAFREGEVRKVIEQIAADGNDQLRFLYLAGVYRRGIGLYGSMNGDAGK